jgi:hypothetical protein
LRSAGDAIRPPPGQAGVAEQLPPGMVGLPDNRLWKYVSRGRLLERGCLGILRVLESLYSIPQAGVGVPETQGPRARAKNAAKRGCGRRVDLETDHLATTTRHEAIEALDEALTRLAIEQPKLAELVELRRFGGLTLAECAKVLGVSARTADTWSAYARARLAVELKDH